MNETMTATRTWVLDAAHSEITFKVKHMMVANVTGSFGDFQVEGDIHEDDMTRSNVRFSAKTASVTTGVEDRDNHLRSADFFDAENHQEMTFASTGFTQDGEDYKMTGDLNIRGISKPVTLNVELGGFGVDPYGQRKAGFTISGKINRKEWGLNWNAALEAGGVLVADEVRINCEIQMMQQ